MDGALATVTSCYIAASVSRTTVTTHILAAFCIYRNGFNPGLRRCCWCAHICCLNPYSDFHK